MKKLQSALWFLPFLLYILLAFNVGFSTDEAHYALYAYFPAWSYFDHPPLVGWVQIPLLWLSSQEGVLRLLPISLWALTLYGMTRLQRVWFGAQAHSRALLVLAYSVVIWNILAVALLPDSLVMALLPWIMLATWRLKNSPQFKDWLWLGLLLGLAGLSKYTAIFIAISVAIVLLRQHRSALWRHAGLWWALLIAAICILPVLFWNAQHDWISIRYQLNHGGAAKAWVWMRFAQAIAAQILAYGFVLIGLTIYMALRPRGVWAVQRHDQKNTSTNSSAAWQFSLIFALPLLGVTLFLSGRTFSLPHWTAAAWLALLPIAAQALGQLWAHCRTHQKRWGQIVLSALLAVQFGVIIFAGVSLWQGGWNDERDNTKTDISKVSLKNNAPFADVHGWSDAAHAGTVLAHTLQTPHLMALNWTLGSRLAWYARPMNVVVNDAKNQQFFLWYRPIKNGESAVVVNWSAQSYALPITPKLDQAGFQSCLLKNTIPVLSSQATTARQISHFELWFCNNWHDAQ